MKFSKYHGCGNDFIIVTKEEIDRVTKAGDTVNLRYAYSEWAVAVCDRHKGIGADGLIIVNSDPEPDETMGIKASAEMIIYNSDGSLASMCGNGIRCFANFCYDEDIVEDDIYPVLTGAGIMVVSVITREPFEVEIDMGRPDYDPKVSAIDTELSEFIGQDIEIAELTPEYSGNFDARVFEKVSTFFMGTVHTVIWEDEMHSSIGVGKLISEHPVFKKKTNVNFVEIIDRNNIKVRTYERGVGYTQACGTGACASVVLGIKEGKLNNEVRVVVPGGELLIRQEESYSGCDSGTVFMQGPSQKIAEGTFISAR